MNIPVAVKIMVLTTLEKRGNEDSFFFMTEVVEDLTKSIKKMLVPSQFANELVKDKFYCLRNVTVGDIIKMNTRSMIFQCGPFPYDKEEVQSFLVPAEVSVREAFLTPDNKRITIIGILKKVSDILKTEHSIRKILYVEDIGGDSTIQVKLWGEQIKLDIPGEESEIKVTNLLVQTFNGTKTVNGTSSTTVTENSTITDFECTVDGLSVKEDYALVMMCDKMYKVDKSILEPIFPEGNFSANVTIKGKKKGTTIVSMKKYTESSKKMKK